MPQNIDTKIQKFFNIISSEKDFAYDVETTGLKWQKEVVIGYSVSDGKEGFYVPVRHTGGGNIENIDLFEKTLIKKLDEHPAKIIGHNLKFDAHMGENHGIKLGRMLKDTMTQAALINENKFSYSLDACCKEYPDIPQKLGQQLYEHIAQVAGCSPSRDSMGYYHMLPGNDPIAVEYAELDTIATYCLNEKQDEEISSQNLEIVVEMENELTYVLQKMERKGIAVDLEQYKIVKEQVQDLQYRAYANLPLKNDFTPINVRSAKDLKEYFELCDIDDWPMTLPTERFPNGQPSFNKDYLATHDEGLLIIEAKKYDHIISGFIEPFMRYVHNGRIHTNFNQTKTEWGMGAKPGRLSCTEPNLQQVPKRDKFLGAIYRSIFVSDPNYVFVEFDHSQAEPRLYAHYSGEPVLIEGYNKTPFIDMHSIAAELMGVSRDIAKNLNLAILYTMGAPKLARKLRIPLDDAKVIIRKWYRTFRRVAEFTANATERATDRQYVHTILGRRARFPDPRWAYRAANRIIQGSSADILKWKMVEIQKWIEKNKLDDYVHMLVNIHDAILFQIHRDCIAEGIVEKIGEIFTSVQAPPFNLRVPFAEEHHIGFNWAEASYGKAA